MLRRLSIRAFQGILLLISLLFLLLLLLFGMLQTRLGEKKVKALLLYVCASYGADLEIGEISGLLPFQGKIERVHLKLKDKSELSAQEISFRLSLFSFFKQELAFTEIASPRLSLTAQGYTLNMSFAGKGAYLWKEKKIQGSFECSDPTQEHLYVQAKGEGSLLTQSASLQLYFPDLNTLEPKVGGPLSWEMEIKNQEISSSFSSPSLTVDPFLFTVGGSFFFSQRDLQGSLHVKGESGQFPLSLDVDFGLKPEELLEVKDFSLTFPQTTLTGQLSFLLPSFLAAGNLYIESQDIKALSPWDLEGTLGAALTLSHEENQQHVGLSCTCQHLKRGSLLIDSLYCSLLWKDLYNSPSGKVLVKTENVYTPLLSLNELQIEACKASSHSPWNMALSSSGILKEPFELKTSFAWKDRDITLESLEANLLFLPISLRSPFHISWTPEGSFDLSPGIFQVGEGDLQGYFSSSQEEVFSHIEFSLFPLALTTLFSPTFSLEGSLCGEASLHGTPTDLKGNLQLSIQEGNLTHFSQEDSFQTQGSVLVNLTDQALQLQAHLDAKEGQFLNISGTLPVHYTSFPFSLSLPQTEPLQAELTAEGHIEEIFDFVNLGFHRLTGLVTTHLLFSGTLSSPYLQGTLNWSEGSYANDLIGTDLHDVSSHMEAKKDTLYVTTLSATDGKEGSLKGEGEILLNLNKQIPYTLSFDLDKLNTLKFDIISADLSGSLYITGSFKEALAQGNLLVEKGAFHLPDQLPYELPDIPVTYIHRPESVQSEIKDQFVFFPFQMDLTLTPDPTCIVEGKGLHSKWKGSLHVTGTNLNIAAGGKLQLVSGEYLFAGRRFKLTEGEIFFTDEKTKTAYIQLKGVVSLGDMEVTAQLSGPLTHPQLTFQSNPHLPTSSILAKVLFNKEISEINQFEAVQLATTLMSLSGGKGPDILDNIRKSLGVDRLTLSPAGKDSQGVAVQIGKYLTKGVMVTLSQSASSTQVIVEVELGEGFVFQAETQEVEEGKFSIKWRHSY